MIDSGKQNVVGVLVDAIDYEAATARVIRAATLGEAFGATALAVHGVMEAVADPELRYRVNQLEMVTADGQAVRWGMNLLHRAGLPERCYGPTLMLRICEAAAEQGLPVFLYGSRSEVLDRLSSNLQVRIPGLLVAGAEPSVFGRVSPLELDAIAERIRASGARIVFGGLGCPRQEVFSYELRERVRMPVLAVGAAFDYHAGLLTEPPLLVQRAGLQWLWRIAAEPRRLLGRYLRTNPAYIGRVALQRFRIWNPDTTGRAPAAELGYA